MEASYWYHGQVRKIILHTLRIFSNFCISTGKDKDGKDILRRVPVTFMSTDKSALYQINNATDTVIETCPKMVLTISEIRTNNQRGYSAPYEPYETEVTEKVWNEETGNYEYVPGNSYSVTRFNPIPIGLTFKLYILTTLQKQKFELFEQIRTIFSPTLELQTSENPLDWSRVTAITLTGINYSSKGTSNLESTQLDAMDMTFVVDTNLDAPALIDRSHIIETIATNMYVGNESIEEMYGWEFDEIFRNYYTPHKSSILVKDNKSVVLKPGSYSNWIKLFNAYGINYNPNNRDIYLHCKIGYKEVLGVVKLNPLNDMELIWNIEKSTLPKTTIPDIDGMIDPHEYEPENKKGERYLILAPIGSGTQLWGIIKDIDGNIIPSIDANCIIEYDGNNWVLMTNPSANPLEYYVRDKDDDSLWTWNDEYQCWVDVINGTFREGYWRISQI